MSAHNLENRLLYWAAVAAGATCLLLAIKSLAVSELAQSVAHLTQAAVWVLLMERFKPSDDEEE